MTVSEQRYQYPDTRSPQPLRAVKRAMATCAWTASTTKHRRTNGANDLSPARYGRWLHSHRAAGHGIDYRDPAHPCRAVLYESHTRPERANQCSESPDFTDFYAQ